MYYLLYLTWDPNPVAFKLPVIGIPIYLYGIFFVSGFFAGYYLLRFLLQKRLACSPTEAQNLLDPLTWAVVLGTIIGARLGHVLFYEWDYYKQHLWQIFNLREGGLASHGGTIGVLFALWIYYRLVFQKKSSLSFLSFLDLVVIPTALVATCIRLGNFFNQEIVGTPSELPWAVYFLHPVGVFDILPRHPVQLYEASGYFFTFVLLLLLWNQSNKYPRLLTPGFFTGLFFVCVFGSRFFLEFFKAFQPSIIDQSLLSAGQLLSLPCIIGGLYLLFQSRQSSA